MNEQISVDCRTFQTLAIQSLRYCMGGSSLACFECADLIKYYWIYLDKKTRTIITRDLHDWLDYHIHYHEKHHAVRLLENDVEYKTWQELREWINKQA